MKITVLDAKTLGGDLSFDRLGELGEVECFDLTPPEEIAPRLEQSEVAVVNKLRLSEKNLKDARRLRLICVTATGYDNIDTAYCASRNIGVANVVGYSTDSVAQLTAAIALELFMRLGSFSDFVKSGEYAACGVANRLTPTFNELAGKTWGIVGLGNIGKRVAEIARAFGCRVICTKRTPGPGYEIVPLDELMARADIVSVHLPLTEQTRGIINRERLALMKDGAVFVNVARGAVTDERALADEARSGRLYVGADVYSSEPFDERHPFWEIKNLENVLLTPHMAWGAYEARVRCIDEVAENIRAFINGERRNRVEQ